MDKKRSTRKTAHSSRWKTGCIFALILALAISLCACSGTNSKADPDKTMIYAKIDKNGTAYLPLMDGNVITIKGDVSRAVVMKDRNTILVLERNGLLYATTAANLEERTTIAEDAIRIDKYTASGVLYKNADNEICRYLFADDSTISVDIISLFDITATDADNTLSLLYGEDNGNIYLLPEGATEPEKIAHFDNDFYALAVSDDGKTALWAEYDFIAGTHTVYCYTNGNRIMLEEADSKCEYIHAEFNKSQTFLGVADTASRKVYTVTFGNEKVEEITTVKLGNDLNSYFLYTKNGALYDEISDIIDGLYVMVKADSILYYPNVYYVEDGNREKVLSGVREFKIAAGRIYYIDEDGDLNTAKLNGSELEAKSKVSSDVETFRISSDGNYAYYFKNSDDNVGTLSRYSVKTDESEKISSNAYSCVSTYSDFNNSTANFFLSTDGKTVYYFEDVEEDIGGTHIDIGTLKYATVGSEPVKIATDILVEKPVDGMDSNYINPTSFTIVKYIDDEDEVVVNWMYFDGTEAKIIAKNVYDSV